MTGYFDLFAMNAAMDVFEGKEAIVGIDQPEWQHQLQPYQMIVVREGFERAFIQRNIYEKPHLVVTEEQILLKVETIWR